MGTLMLSPERQSAKMSQITNDSLTWSGAGCFIDVPIWQQWTSKVLSRRQLMDIHGDSYLREPLVFSVQLFNKQSGTQSDKI